MLLESQYGMTRFSRKLLFDFLEQEVKEGIHKPVTMLQGKSIQLMLLHNASCYVDWVSYVAMGLSYWNHDPESFPDMTSIRNLYVNEVDAVMNNFLKRYADHLEEAIPEVPQEWGPPGVSPLQIFTQVTTHEFHHKGQIVLACRELGYSPPDTDVRRSFPNET